MLSSQAKTRRWNVRSRRTISVMADDEGPSLGGGSAAMPVGASVGGLAARLAGERYLGSSSTADSMRRS